MEDYHRNGDLAEAQGALEFLVKHLGWLQHLQSTRMPAQMKSLYENLGYIRSFLKLIQETPDDREKIQPLLKQIRDAALQLLVASDFCNFRVGKRGSPTSPSIEQLRSILGKLSRIVQFSLRIDDLVKQIKSTRCNGGHILARETGCNGGHILARETMVGFGDDTQAVLDKLMANQKQLEVISITGMAGIGKTTLAQRLYNDQAVVYHFHIRAWVSVSQIYKTTNVLSSILSSILGRSFCGKDEHEIGEKLYRCLKGQRYLIVLDDMWDIGVWNDIKIYFPSDGNKSRILITTRIKHVASNASSSSPYCLPFLSPEESWHLFTSKLFAGKSCPHELMKIGKKIVAKCKGLPLAIVVVAGLLLKKEKTFEIWSLVAESIGPLIESKEERIMDILALSYEHLPLHLRLCFLYLGKFSEDYEIPVKNLIWSWIAEGYVKQNEENRPEDLAEDYLTELINRNLVIVAKKSSNGRTKTCHIHDLLRELCLKKALEKRLIMLPSNSDRAFTSTCPNLPRAASYKFSRVLDLAGTIHYEFPMDKLRLIHLKYLALHVEHINTLPRTLYLLRHLETFIIQREKGQRITVPYEIWRMKKLRHIQISGELQFEHSPPPTWAKNLTSTLFMLFPSLPIQINVINPLALLHLQTLSQLCASDYVEEILARTPNLRKLGLHLTFSNERKEFSFPDLAGLNLLESVKFEYQTLGMKSIDLPPLEKFPPGLKKMTLIGSHVNWEQISILGMLPNLEVLKIKDNFFSGPRWETIEDGFRCLRFLKLSHMDLKQWITSECHFPKFEQLVLNGCFDLEEIPYVFGDIPTLQVIKVYRSSSSVVDSAWQIQESQQSLGNDEFKVFIYHQTEENNSSVRA